jgi:plastocyanin
MTIGVGCPDDSAGPPTGPTSKPTTRATGAATGTAASTAKPATTGSAAAAPTGATGTIKGVANFAGKGPEMKVPTKRKEAELCKDKEVKYNAVLVNNGKLQDVLVRVMDVKGKFEAPKEKAVLDQKDCMYTPRIQAVMEGQEIDVKNGDATLHNVHAKKGAESLFNQAQPKGSPAITKEWDDSAVIKFTCDVHPWMRAFVVVHDNPFHAVTKDDGSFTIDKVPVGKYEVEAWHSQFGAKKASVEVAEGKTAEIKFDYAEKDEAPADNKDELKGLW